MRLVPVGRDDRHEPVARRVSEKLLEPPVDRLVVADHVPRGLLGVRVLLALELHGVVAAEGVARDACQPGQVHEERLCLAPLVEQEVGQ